MLAREWHANNDHRGQHRSRNHDRSGITEKAAQNADRGRGDRYRGEDHSGDHERPSAIDHREQDHRDRRPGRESDCHCQARIQRQSSSEEGDTR
jgi:hypothetical protein